MIYSVHCMFDSPRFFESLDEADAEYERRSKEPRNLHQGWVGMLQDGKPFRYNGWESGEVWQMCRQQLEDLE